MYKPSLGMVGTEPILRKHLGKKEKTMLFAGGAGKTTRNIDTASSRRRRFSLHDKDVLLLAKWAKIIEEHYSTCRNTPTPMDIEFAKDGKSGKMYIVQARPETVQARSNKVELVSYALTEATLDKPLIEGTSVGQKIIHGNVCVINDVHELSNFRSGSILVTEITDPDWYVLKYGILVISSSSSNIWITLSGFQSCGKQRVSLPIMEVEHAMQQ